jgi:hypothetical protein
MYYLWGDINNEKPRKLTGKFKCNIYQEAWFSVDYERKCMLINPNYKKKGQASVSPFQEYLSSTCAKEM